MPLEKKRTSLQLRFHRVYNGYEEENILFNFPYSLKTGLGNSISFLCKQVLNNKKQHLPYLAPDKTHVQLHTIAQLSACFIWNPINAQ